MTCRVLPGTSSRLDQAIAESQEAAENKLSKATIRKLIMAGVVYVNGRRVQNASKPLRGGEIIDVYWDKSRDVERIQAEKFLPLRVLYEDDAIICFDKPAGLPSQPTVDEARANLYDMAKKNYRYLGMHHRLDRDTSGVILFTREPKYNMWVANQFRDHKIVKVYVAVVHGRLRQSKGSIESFLGPVGKKGKQSKFGSVRSGGKKAITDYLVLAQNEKHSLVEVRIQTGRTHQIRVHFSELKHPIVGDTLYGSAVENYNKFGRFLLHAHALTIEHPVSRNLVRVESPIPPEFRL